MPGGPPCPAVADGPSMRSFNASAVSVPMRGSDCPISFRRRITSSILRAVVSLPESIPVAIIIMAIGDSMSGDIPSVSLTPGIGGANGLGLGCIIARHSAILYPSADMAVLVQDCAYWYPSRHLQTSMFQN